MTPIEEPKNLFAKEPTEPQMPTNAFPPIRDADALEHALNQFLHLRNHPRFQKLNANCTIYFHALQYQDAHQHGTISLNQIAKKIGTRDTQVGRWLIQKKEPRLIWLIHHERTQAATLKDLLHTETHREPHDNPILRAANDPEFRKTLLLLGEFTTQHIERLLTLRTRQDPLLDPTQFTTIKSYQDYETALCAFPLLQTLPHFDRLHQHMKLYYHLKASPPRKANGKLPIGALTQHYQLTKGCIHNWLNNLTQPDLKTTIEHRATSLKAYQHLLHALRQRDNSITTTDHLHHRISSNHFHFANHLTTNPAFPKQFDDTTRYLAILQLVDAGHHPIDLDRHFHLHTDYTGDTLRYQHRPHLIKLAATIPSEPPQPKHRWLPTTNDDKRYPTRYIHAPHTITDWQQLIPILDQLPPPTHPDTHLTRQLNELGLDERTLHNRAQEYGPVETLHERLLAFAYLIGTSLSDGWIQQHSTLSSSFGIELSKKYHWATHYGERTAHYWTQLSVPTIQAEGRPIAVNRPHGAYNWYSITTPLLTYFNEEVLGFNPGETHTHSPANVDWILQAPREFQIKVIQGLFDGDGWANSTLDGIGIHNHQNRDFVESLLRQNEIHSTPQGKYILSINSKEGIKTAANLPVFLSATGRQQNAIEAAKMCDAPRLGNRPLPSLISQQIRKLSDDGFSSARIRVAIYKEHNIVLSTGRIDRIIQNNQTRTE